MKHLSPGVALFFLLVIVVSALWAYGDADRRDKPGCAVALLVLLFWPLGLLIWVIFRPDQKRELVYESATRPINTSRFAPTFCDDCNSLLIQNDEGVFCPHCERKKGEA